MCAVCSTCILLRKLAILLCSLFFFFSSRRRHTRYIGDWSSDVCSSDLEGHELAEILKWGGRDYGQLVTLDIPGAGKLTLRSEERRVGKECRSRWSPYQQRKKREKHVVDNRRRAPAS